MKRTSFYLILSFSVGLGAILSSCTKKKEEEPVPQVEETKKKEVKQSDQSGTSAADEAIDDVNSYINNNIGGGGNQKRVETYALPCGVISVDSTGSGSAKTYRLKYGSQTKCGYSVKKKSGLVSFQLISGTKFSDSLAVFRMTFTDYVVEVEATGDIVKINGNITSKNMTGGYAWESITANKTRIHKIRGSYDVTYANGAVRNKKYYHTRTYASASSWAGFNLTVAGDTTTADTEPGKVSEIGRTLDGDYYYETHISKDFNWFNTSTTYAGPYVLREGKAKMKVTVPNISPAYFEVEAGYNTTNGVVSATPVNNANSNTYKITTVINTTTVTQYQLY